MFSISVMFIVPSLLDSDICWLDFSLLYVCILFILESHGLLLSTYYIYGFIHLSRFRVWFRCVLAVP
jgi:hypothetical protein